MQKFEIFDVPPSLCMHAYTKRFISKREKLSIPLSFIFTLEK